ncbi:aldehyde dehydrogenase [Acidisoma cellulosilytica]|uniref:Aldehyde dehydrogenase n=1 Tax=Acidisoma cellulosilyticum TaxID=2802395 RepID=A0A964E531_9PROT|nr:aldehyde dehydrogenase family protein [Acidisoma cellulosilyticum]MCB8882074.1 aldehyde dehydrogenase [Acidisoma cellulosilyticum]
MSLDFDPNSLAIPQGHHIGGRFVAMGSEEIAVLRPSDHQLLGVITDGGEAAVDAAVDAARAALAASGWNRIAPLQRARVLHAFANAVEADATYLAQLEAASSSRLIKLTTVVDVIRTAGVIRYYAEFCDKIEGTITATENGVMSLIRQEPYGIVGAIAPWNFPMITAAWKFAPALAAGNAVVMKTSELTPHTLLALAEIATRAGLPAGLFNVVNGYGTTTGAAIVRHPAIGKISFTGSTATGAAIMTLAAQSGIKPVTLELGGKSPALVFDDHGDLAATAAKVTTGFTGNAGQVCTAGSRLIVQRRTADALLEAIEKNCLALRPGATWEEATTFAPIISEKQVMRIESLVEKTLDEGASLRIGGQRMEGRNAGAYFAPTILEGVSEQNTGFREEFFGPVLIVDRFDDPEEGIAKAAHPTYGLAANVYGRDLKQVLAAVEGIEAGMIWVNQPGRAPEFAFPAGGFKGSGFGKDMGRAGIEAFLRQKAAWINYAA